MQLAILQLLKIKPHETAVVKKLFAVQFLLGVSTAFLFTSSLTTFISAYQINALPYVYITSALLLIFFNRIYSYLDERMTSPKLLEGVILFSILSVFVFWLSFYFFPFDWVSLLLAAWYLVIYMLINYAFWGMASMLFNVRESRRLFSLVGAGDIPAKMLGYAAVTALVPVVGVTNLLWVSIGTGLAAWLLVKSYRKNAFLVAEDPNLLHHATPSGKQPSNAQSFIDRFFGNRIVFFISIFSFLSYVIFALMDFTFLAGVKFKYQESGELAAFLGIFFASGRLMAVFFKLLFSSRLIAAIGLANSLLVTPVLLLLITTCVLFIPENFASPFLVFGIMVLLSEMLRSTLQEPVFFILFQPLKPHDRLQGHLVAKGHTMPFALLGVGLFLLFYLKTYGELSIFRVAELLIIFLLLWCVSVFLIKSEYVRTLTGLLKKGYFTGSTLFLNDDAVRNILIKKAETGSALEKIHALNLLEKSGYPNRHQLLLKLLQQGDFQVRNYVLLRVIANNMTSALPLIKQQLTASPDQQLSPRLYQALFFLQPLNTDMVLQELEMLTGANKKAAMIGLLLRKQGATNEIVFTEVEKLSKSNVKEQRLLALEIIRESGAAEFSAVVSSLLNDPDNDICKKAIETIGSIKDFSLFDQVLAAVSSKRLYKTLAATLIQFGDDAFAADYCKPELLNDSLSFTFIKAAGKVTGEASTAFLINYLNGSTPYRDEVIKALWLKKASINKDNLMVLEKCIMHKLDCSNLKLQYHAALQANAQLKPLREALFKEIKSDVDILLRLYSFIYDAAKINRITEVFSLGNASRMHNAIEMLELTLPTKYFAPTNHLLEWMQDVQMQKSEASNHTGSPTKVLKDIFLNNEAEVHVWTKSVACYSMLYLKKDETLTRALIKSECLKTENLFQETRNYVLSTLNN